MEFLLGLRVVRGPDWSWGDQDGGEGHVGTVVEVEEGQKLKGSTISKSVMVQWDCGGRCRYRCCEGMYDLRVFDTAPAGLKFPHLVCNGCHTEGLIGFVWKCLKCCDYYLCSPCYLAGKHNLEHRFDCSVTKLGKKVRAPPRASSERVAVKGLFPGALVVRGHNWRWGDQDGGVGSLGKLLSLKGWQTETARSVAQVEWKATGRKNVYRIGHNGKVDLKCTAPGNGGLYYPDHLPVLGAPHVPPGPKEFASGDRVMAEVDMDVFKALGSDNAALTEHICVLLDHAGTVNSIMDSGELLVRYPNNNLHPIDPQAATKVDIPSYEVGDVVRVIDDIAEVFRLQKGHGEWNDDMALALGQVGRVSKEFSSGDIQVCVDGRRWTFNSCCLQPAPDEDPPYHSGEGGVGVENQLKLLTLMEGMSPDIVIAATSAGDVSTLRRYLQNNPHQVNARYEGKTAVHVAIEEGHTDILKTLLEFKADLELEVSDTSGDKPLHHCAFVNQLDAAKVLLDAGVDVNTKNRKGNTPIMVAAAVGHYKFLKFFANHPKINLHAQDAVGCTALHHAVTSQRTKSVMMLLAAGADPTLLNFRCFAPIHDAAGYGFLPALEEFLYYRPEHVNLKRPDDGHVALHIAAANNRLDVATLLLQMTSCDINAKNDLNRTPLHTAAIEGHSRVVECMVGYGADLNTVDDEGNSPLHVVLIKKNAKPLSSDTPQMNNVRDNLLSLMGKPTVSVYMVMACFLAQEGSDIHIKNKRGHNAMQLCPEDMGMLMINFVNSSSRGAFHGTLRGTYEESIESGGDSAGEELPSDAKSDGTTPTASPKPPMTPESDSSKVTEAPGQPSVGQTSEEHTKPQTVENRASTTDLCFLCESPSDVRFDPCGHCVMCSVCAKRAKRCPSCRVLLQKQTGVLTTSKCM